MVEASRKECAMEALPKVTLYVDGACLGNPGKGGYAVVLCSGNHRRELSGGRRFTTNNRMELLAVIEGLKALKTRCSVLVISDAKYLVDSMEQGWARRWRQRGWMLTSRKPTSNADLWEQCLDLCEQHEVVFQWVRGHSGVAENECCDRSARQAALADDLPVDEGYEQREQATPTGSFHQGTLFD
jgi:ribonuclease HI